MTPLTEEQQKAIDSLKTECNEFRDKTIQKINDITNSLDYINGSVFSYNADRLNHFVDGLNDFEPRFKK